ncbi:MAG: diaminopimelate epimerase [Elusimicrobiota bacterium]|jgi:diaminopimelate epimerase|nr:diaminopimelate epimerase [Elusimicrobiota bacterium]
MEIDFSKLSAAGNDFVLIDNRNSKISAQNYQNITKKLCDRKYAIGADGLIFLEKSENADFKMKYFNSDGSHASMCGNGGRSVAKFAYVLGAAREEMVFETDAGIVNAEIFPNDRVKLSLYEPKNLKRDLKITVYEKEFNIDFIDTGVPHAVIFADDIEKIDVVKYGRFLRHHSNFAPDGTNVDFVQVLAGNTLLVRTYERGVEDETLACGTGITACGIISVLKNLAVSPVKIIARGGDNLEVSLETDNKKVKNVTLEGPAVVTFEGNIKI